MAATPKKQKLLVVDDNDDILSVIRTQFKISTPDLELITLQDPKEVLKIARKETPDVILLDVILPGMTGFEVCNLLKAHENTKHIPIIMMTAIRIDPESRVKGLDSGADAFLAKPINASELVAQVKVMLRIKAVEDRLRNEKSAFKKSVTTNTRELSKERKKCLDAQEKFRLIFENITDPIAIHMLIFDETKTPVDYYFADVNTAFEGQMNLKKDDIVGKPVQEVAPDLAPFWLGGKRKALMTGRTVRVSHHNKSLGKTFDISAFRLTRDEFAVIFHPAAPHQEE